MNIRTTLEHEVLGSVEISPPDGWKEAKFKMERHPEGHSLIEYFNGEFIFYGSNGTDDGGIDFLIQVIDTYGFDAVVDITFEISFDDVTYPISFSAQLDIESMEHMPMNKMKVPVLRDDLWNKFITRFDTPVNLKSTEDLDGETIVETDNIELSLPSQLIRYNSEYRNTDSYTYSVSAETLEAYITVGWFVEIVSDIDVHGVFTKENIFNNIIQTFVAPWNGSYRIQVQFSMAAYNMGTSTYGLPDSATQFYLQRRNGSPIQLTRDTAPIPFANNQYIFSIDVTLNMVQGDSVVIYGEDDPLQDQALTILGETRWNFKTECVAATTSNISLFGVQTIDGYSTSLSDRVLVKDQAVASQNGIYIVNVVGWSRATDMNSSVEFDEAAVYVANGDINGDTSWKQTNTGITIGTDAVTWEFMFNSNERFTQFSGYPPENYILITADTTYDKTSAEGFLIHDAGAGIIERQTGQNAFYSDFFGSQTTAQRGYAEDGCGWTYALVKFLQIRQYLLSEKPFFCSFKNWWDGANPIFNLGFGYDVVGDNQVIRVEPKEFFYADETPLVNFSYVQLTKRFDTEMIYNKVRVGFKKWESEDTSGIDDPQTKRTYANSFKKSGAPLEIYSDFIAASLTIESARRTTREKSEDYKHDNDIAIISITGTDFDSPDGLYQPELDDNFSAISDLNNSESRYNIRLTPARAFLRWLNVFNGFMQKYLAATWRFVSGEGNYDMASTMSGSDCDAANFSGASLDEGQDISPTTDYLFIPEEYDCTIDITHEQYLLIQGNRSYPIGISQTDEDHASFYIKDLEYMPFESKATMKIWPKEPFTLIVT